MQLSPVRTIDAGSPVLDMAFHPSRNLVSLSLVNGRLDVWDVQGFEEIKRATFDVHSDFPVRRVLWSNDGQRLVTSDKLGRVAVVDADTGAVSCAIEAVGSPDCNCGVSALAFLNPSVLVTGDDMGLVRGWDLRMSAPGPDNHAIEFWENEDTIHEILTKGDHVICGSGEYLEVFDVKAAADPLVAMSDECEEDLVAMTFAHQENKILTSLFSSGDVAIWDYDDFGYFRSKVTGHPDTVNAMAMYNQGTVLTGCGDGRLRVASVRPTGICGTIATHCRVDNDSGTASGINCLQLTPQKDFAVTAADDNCVKFWDLDVVDSMVHVYESRKSKNEEVLLDDDDLKQLDMQQGNFFADLETDF
ncbi:MAG: hypothetical protein KVP17_003607 [Porospora cf. gigantea B]|uniref:uncharacterized protein n=2 Tax=Porospora cf. gigantea B TaxID=2853592 RepID=UPI0035719D27|nr:MAG: hypothetical protein KVP17_003607 [Porospora cf. gigantea B]